MIHKSDDLVEIPCTDADLDDVLREAGIEVTPDTRVALKDLLTKIEDHPLNKGRGKPTVFVPGANVHFRLVPTLYTAVIATLGTAVAIATLPLNPLVSLGTGALTAAQVIKDMTNQFNHLNAQEAAVFGALNETIASLRKKDPRARDASAAQVEGEIRNRDPMLARGAAKTLEILATRGIVSATPRDGDIYYTPKL